MNRIIKENGLSVEIKASVVYIFASLLSKGLAIVTVPIFTRLMSTEQMGIVNLFNSWQSTLGAIASLSLTSGGYMVAMREYEESRDEYMSSVLTLTSIIASIMILIYIIDHAFWELVLGLPTSTIILMLLNFFLSPATDFWLARQRYEYKYVATGIITIISSILASIVSVIAVILASNLHVESLGIVRLFSSYIVTLGMAMVLWIFIMLKGKTFVNKIYWQFSLRLSIPLVGNSIAMQVLNVSDRIMISKIVGNSAVGIYGVLYTVSSISLIVWNAINSSFVPFLFENIENESGIQIIKKTSTQLMAAYGTIAVGITLIAPEIVQILATKEYYEAIYIMPPIAAGIFFTSISNMYSNVLIYYRKTQYVMISSGIAALINVILNYFCIEIWGYMAAAYTTLIAYIILAILQAIISRKIYRKVVRSEKQTVYNDKGVLVLSMIIVASCLGCLPLYFNTGFRYCIIVSMIIIGMIFRKKLMSILNLRR